MTVVLDANILLRLAQFSAPQHAVADEAINRLRQQGKTLRSLPQSYYEFWVVATRPITNNGLGLSVAEVTTELARIDRFFPVLDDPPTLFAE